MQSKDVLRHFRTAVWRSPREIEAFLQEAGALPPAEMPKLLAMLLDRSLLVDDVSHRARVAAFAAFVERSSGPELGAELFVPSIRALKVADANLRATLVRLMPRFNNVGGHIELCQVVGSGDPEVRKGAAEVLRQVGGKTAFEVLEQLVRQPAFAGRIEAMDVMVPKAQHHTIPLLLSVLTMGKPEERAHALRHLGDMRYMAKDRPRALQAALTALKDNDATVLSQAIGTISGLAEEEDFYGLVGDTMEAGNASVVRAIVEAMGRYGSPRALAVLTRKFGEGPNAVRQAVLDAVEVIGREEVLPLLVDALGNKHIVIRTRAASIVSKLSVEGRIDVARSILWLLRSRDVNIRRIAVEIANQVGDPRGDLAPRLLRFLRDEDWWVRERVMDALVEMAGATLTRHLVEYLSDPSDVIRRFAIGALMRIKDPKSLGALVRVAMNDPDWWAREQAVEAVAMLGDPRAVPYLCDFLARQPELRFACVTALGKLNAKEAAPQIAELLTDDNADIRFAAIECLGELDDRAQGLWVKACENDPVIRVRTAARELLTRWALAGPRASRETGRAKAGTLDALLLAMTESEADDLLIAADRPPYMKRHGKMTPLSAEILTGDQVKNLIYPHISLVQMQALEAQKDVDFSHDVQGTTLRFRANVFHQFTGMAAVFRTIKNIIPLIEELGLPAIVNTFGSMKNGLVLVGGPTGSGKSTTLAALVDHINRTSSRHIITIEDPIEVVHTRKGCLINQREVGTHTRSFESALRATVREDPDVILVGEMRDLDTIAFAVTASETGHLVFGTVHTVSADTSIDRLVNAFPAEEQPQVRALLGETLRAVVCQHLVRRKDQPGRIAVVEVMLNNDAVSNMIRKGKTFQIPSVLVSSRDVGMQSMDSELVRLVKEGKIFLDEAYMKANDKKAFEIAVGMVAAAPQAGSLPPVVSAAGR